ncbi:MAG: DUF1460 domain-containing protein [Ignavibacteria bacterium]|jgi:hypothetical protein
MRFLLALFFVSLLHAQVYTQKDVEVCDSVFNLAVSESLQDKPINEIIIEIGKTLIGTDYQAHTIEPESKEEAVIYLTGFDCYTFLETCLAFSRCLKQGETNFDHFVKEVINIRYRNGKIKEYPSRLHYFSDWIYDTDKRGITKDITKEIGGKEYKNNVNFMSTHPGSYKHLKDNPEFVEEMKNIEKDISSRLYYYIPQDQIEKLECGIQSGDLIGITTNVKGLDISHTGIAYKKENGRIHLMHAPSIGSKVHISELPLSDYIKKNKIQTGVMIARPL